MVFHFSVIRFGLFPPTDDFQCIEADGILCCGIHFGRNESKLFAHPEMDPSFLSAYCT